MRRRRFLAAAGAAGAGALGGCLGLATDGGGEYDVGMTAETFEPARLTVAAGETVVWKNTSTRAHSVTAYEHGLPDGAAFFATGGYGSEQAAREAWDGSAGAITSGQTYERAFEVPGEYRYFCIPHEAAGMMGTVVVVVEEK